MKKLSFAFDYIFPTFILPNALNPKFGMINYIISQHNDKVSYNTFLEEEGNWWHTAFDSSFGHNQNTLTGFIFEAPVYKNKIRYEYQPLYFATQQNKKFIYSIKPTPIIENFIGEANDGNSDTKISGEYFWKFISKKALNQIINGTGIILIDYSMEPFIPNEIHKKLHKCLEDSNIPKNSIYIIVNSFNAKELYESWFTNEEQRYNILHTPFCLEHSSWYYDYSIKRNENICMNINDFLNTKNTLRKNHFIMKIKAPKEHRTKILLSMIDDDLIQYGDFSFSGCRNFANTTEYESITKNLNLKNSTKVIEFINKSPYQLQNEQTINFNDINAWTDVECSSHMNSYMDICFESFFYIESNSISLTEKIFKSIINFQPFVFIATKGTLQQLKKLGFKTFEGFIDETYDSIEDNDERLAAAYLEIKKICSMSKEDIHKWYWEMEDILIHNHNHLLSIHKNKMITEEVYDTLCNLTNA
jgi:hypothetical protein